MHIIIPARYASTRLPAKPLADIAGKPLIQHVYERAREVAQSIVIIATDDDRIRTAAERFGAQVCMTSVHHRSGTERLAEVIETLGIGEGETVVNLQGDEPLMPPTLIRQVADTLASRPDAVVATACHKFEDQADITNPNVVKVVFDEKGYALYFSRAPIPWPREATAGKEAGVAPAYRHIGLYAYRAGFVRRYAAWSPCQLEEIEQLEQLRVLWHGERIAVCQTRELPGPGVDTPDDLDRVRALFSKGRTSSKAW
jgi:3-deoxy-manno-octulosonate cytidylyltransferase (CMP-KDO synthetase)